MLVSIITVVLNSREFIETAINSVLHQRYPYIEYIIIDGGSTDGTGDIILKYKDRVSKFLSERDSGLYDAMNKGLRLANGNIVGFLNSDDLYVDENVIERVVKTMIETDSDSCYGDLVHVYRKDTNKIIRYWKSHEYREGIFKKGWMPPHPTFFAKRWIYHEYGGFNTDFEITADYELMLRFLQRYKVKICYIPKVLVKMRIGGKSNRSFRNFMRGVFEVYKAYKLNSLRVTPLIGFLEPLSKIPQYFRKSGHGLA